MAVIFLRASSSSAMSEATEVHHSILQLLDAAPAAYGLDYLLAPARLLYCRAAGFELEPLNGRTATHAKTAIPRVLIDPSLPENRPSAHGKLREDGSRLSGSNAVTCNNPVNAM